MTARAKIRGQMNEDYRTLLGHFHRGIGHYHWERLIRDSEHLQRFRSLFGDETLAYDPAPARYYNEGLPAD